MNTGSPIFRGRGRRWMRLAAGLLLSGAGHFAFGQVSSTQPADGGALRPLGAPRSAALPATRHTTAPQTIIIAPRAAPIVGPRGFEQPGDTEGFTVRKGDPTVADELAAFEEAAQRGEWDKAFAELAKVVEAPADAMARRPDGFYLSARARVQRMLVALPPAGREAYRLFNDAAARRGLEEIDSPEPPGSAASSVERLQGLFDRYFITSVGDQIADRLGDAKFESGDFAGAAACWAAIHSDYPDTSLSTPRILAKRAIALARGGQWDELEIAKDQLREKYADEPVRFGGRDISIATLVSGLPPAPGASTFAQKPEPSPTPIASLLPAAGTGPSWKMVFLDGNTLALMERQTPGRPTSATGSYTFLTVPAAQAAGNRVYLNWMGIGIAIDASTGKLLWRSESFNTMPSRLQFLANSPYQFGESSIELLTGGERLLLANGSTLPRTVSVPAAALGAAVAVARAGMAQPTVRMTVQAGSGVLTCLAADTGQQVWSSETVAELNSWNLLGRPLIVEDVAYMLAMPIMGRSPEVTLLAISLSDGGLRWKMAIGAVGSGPNFRGLLTPPRPVLARRGDTLYVLTGAGALLAVNLPGRRVDWAFTCEPPPTLSLRALPGYDPSREDGQFGSCMQLSGSTLLFKERGSRILYSIDPSGPSLKWKRPIDGDKSIVAVDASTLYVLGEELNAIDLKTREMRWSTPTPLGTRQFKPLLEGLRAYVFGTLGIYALDLQSGVRETFIAPDRSGGAVLRLGDRLICVSNRSVTAYSIAPAATTHP